MRDQLKIQMDIPIFDTRRGLRLTPLAAALITLVGTLALAADEPSVPPTSGTPSGSDRVLPPNVTVPVNVVSRLFPEVAQEVATGQNSTAVGNPKATRSVIYANSDNSKKVTISVDQYASSSDASSAYEAAVQKSKMVPGFKPISAPNLGPHAFVGTVTQGAETHVGVGALDDTLIVGGTLVGYEPTPGNIAKLIKLTRTEQETAKGALDIAD
jgi:hypothetical protein